MKEFILSEQWYWLLLIAVLSYMVGSVSAARIISKSQNKDITKIGSGNPGSMNMTRTFGIKIGILTLFFDALKGAIPVLVTHFIYKNYVISGTGIIASDYVRYMSAVFVVIGHIYPVFSHFKGGKGIAPTFGGFWAGLSCESLWFILIVFVGLVLVICYIDFSEWGAMGSLMGITLCCVVQSAVFVFHYGATFSLWLGFLYANVVAMYALDWYAHRANVRRLFAGEEHRTSLKSAAKKK
jgi:glycerol-3-phosphate acyltransferase PlsY